MKDSMQDKAERLASGRGDVDDAEQMASREQYPLIVNLSDFTDMAEEQKLNDQIDENNKKRQTIKTNEGETLYQALPDCDHQIRAKELWEGGGIECKKCKGWFCY